jgi:hypothetical protein
MAREETRAFPDANIGRGMLLRDYFAAHAMQGILAGRDAGAKYVVEDARMLSAAAYRIADEMMLERDDQRGK